MLSLVELLPLRGHVEQTEDDALYRLSMGLQVQIVLTFDDVFICVSETAANIYRDNTTQLLCLFFSLLPILLQSNKQDCLD